MLEQKVVNKVAYDEEGNKLGEIVDLRGSDRKVLIQDKPHIIILVKTVFWKKNLKIAIATKKIIRIEEKKVILSISKNEFRKVVRTLLVERKRFVNNAKLAEASEGSKAATIVYHWRGG